MLNKLVALHRILALPNLWRFFYPLLYWWLDLKTISWYGAVGGTFQSQYFSSEDIIQYLESCQL